MVRETSDGSREKMVWALQKSPKVQLQAVLRVYKGEVLAELRQFVRKADGSWTPTARGVSLPVEQVEEFGVAARALRDEVARLLARRETATPAAQR